MRARCLAILIVIALAAAGCARKPAAQAPPAPEPQPAQLPTAPAPTPPAAQFPVPPAPTQPPAAEAPAPPPQAEKPPATQEQPQGPESQATAARPGQPQEAAATPAAPEAAATPSAEPAAPGQPAVQPAAPASPPAQPAPAAQPAAPPPVAQPVDLGPAVPLPYSTDFATADALKVWRVHHEAAPSPSYRVPNISWEAEGGRLTYQQKDAGHLTVQRLDRGAEAWVLSDITVGSKDWKDYEVGVALRAKSVGGEIGVIFGYQSPERYYRLTFGHGEIRIERREADRMAVLDIWRDWHQASHPYKKEIPVRVAFAHGRIAVWIDNEQFMNISETAIPGGKAGLFAAGKGVFPPDPVEFTRFSVKPVPDPKAVAPQPINVLSVEAGAGVIHRNFISKGRLTATDLLDKDNTGAGWRIVTKDFPPPYEMVFRFPRGWWARLESITFVKRGLSAIPPRDVEVWASLTSPLEGFQRVGAFALANKQGEETFPLRGVWARYLKLRVLSGHDPTGISLEQVRAVGTLHPAAPDLPAPLRDELQEVESNDTPEKANPLPLGKTLAGELPTETDKDVFRITIPQALGDTLRLDIDPRTAGAPELAVTDSTGATVAMVPPEKLIRRPTRIDLKVKPGDYWVTLARQPASVVFLFDDSDSIQGYLNVVKKLMLVNLDKLAGKVPIMMIRYAGTPEPVTDFTMDAAVLRAALEKGQGKGGGTDTIWGLQSAFEALRPRGGNRIIFWVLDILDIRRPDPRAAYQALHEEVAREPVRLYMLATGFGQQYDSHIGLFDWERMMELADRRGGKFWYAPTEREVKDVGQRILDDLAGPMRYALRAEVIKGEPEMGEVVVRFAPEVQAITRNLEIILDASGSMNAKLGKGTRWTVAKQVLADLVRQLPSDINVSLRVFGHRQGGPASCKDSELLIPPGRVQPEAIIARVNALRARGETPLVANLLLAGRDLARAKAGTVVAITDGEESCGGNTKTVASQLQAQGVQLVVNIVGFNLPNAKAIADWKSVAQSTGGRFFDAKTAGDLSAALREAVKLEYVALDATGKDVGKARVGEPLRLPEGTYTIVVRAGQPARVEGVKVTAKEPAALVLRRQGPGWALGPERPR